jgi:hypothetical protein
MATQTVRCRFCGRLAHNVPYYQSRGDGSGPAFPPDNPLSQKIAYAYGVHRGYGCDTGCCGHEYYLCAEDGEILFSEFDFFHGGSEGLRAFAHPHRVHIHWNECDGLDIDD